MNDPPRRGTLRSRANVVGSRVSTMRLKFLLAGDSGCGKTQWLRRAVHEAKLEAKRAQAARTHVPLDDDDDEFVFDARSEATVGVDFECGGVVSRAVRSGGVSSSVRLQANVFDLSGAHSHAKVRAEFYSDFAGLLLAFDLGSKASFEHLDAWMSEVAAVRGGTASDLPHVLVLGLKADVDRRGAADRDIRAWCKTRGASYFECSAKTGLGVAKAWEYLLEHAQGEAKPSPQAQQQQQQAPPSQQRPPSASPSHSPSPSFGGGSHGGATNISDLSVSELRRELTKRSITGWDESTPQSELLTRLREFLSRERAAKASATATEASRLDRMRESVLEDVARWSRGKDVRAMLNDIHGWSAGEASFLEKHTSFAPVQLAYKKALIKIHPDKVPPGEDGGAAHLRATEMFKTVNAAFEAFKKINDKRLSAGADATPQQSPTHSPPSTAHANPTPRARGPTRRG